MSSGLNIFLNKKILIYGLGKSGLATFNFLKKKSEILQLLTIDPKLAVLDETDSGLDVDALRTVAKGVNKFKNENNSVLIITHYQRLLDYIKPDVVHLMIDGQIVKTGDMSLVEKVEKDGYSWLEK